MISEVTGVLLAGGQGVRMGRDKALIPYRGKPLAAIVYEALASLFPRVLVVGRPRPALEFLPVPPVPDLVPDCGVLGGIVTGLTLSHTPWIFVSACDLPYFDTSLAAAVVSHRREGDAVIPRSSRGLEPLFAVYGKSCLPLFRARLDQGVRRILEAAEGLILVHPRLPPPAEGAPDPLFNLNTPEDLETLG